MDEILIRLVSSEMDEREDGMAGSGRMCSSGLSKKAPGTKRGVLKSSVPSWKEPVSGAADEMEAASSWPALEVLDSRLV